MAIEDSFVQLTFYYLDGRTESFSIAENLDSTEPNWSIRQDLRHRLKQPWCILHLPEETVFINMANIYKIELKPSVPQLQGEEVFSQAERLTPLTRSNTGL
ncbi:hypothetical protein [Lyngbya aestuarii]|uniref:hypothetical protein n=1 Tax=Lyngbya aestuarii TaxID=118322 RepID=UPI00403DE6DB